MTKKNLLKCATMLYLPLKAKWYNMIESGVKTEEYREDKPYWCRRLLSEYVLDGELIREFKEYKYVCFSYGYTKRKMVFEIDSILLGVGRVEWGAPENRAVFKIKLGRRIS